MTYEEMLTRINNTQSLVGTNRTRVGGSIYPYNGVQGFRILTGPDFLTRILTKLWLPPRCVWCGRKIDYPAVLVWGNELNGGGGFTRTSRLACINLAECEGYREARHAVSVERLNQRAAMITVGGED